MSRKPPRPPQPQNKLPQTQAQPGQPSVSGKPVSVTTHNTQVFQGPLPPPEILARFDQIVPGAAERIIRLAETEVAHRQEQERSATQANITAQKRQLDIAELQVKLVHGSDRLGQALGFLVSAACLAASVYLGLNGQPWLAAVLASLPLAAIIRALRERGNRPQPPASKK